MLKYFKNKLSGGGWFLVLIILLGIGLRIFYLSYTDYNKRTYDVDGHIDYIKYVAQNYSMPQGEECWECHQQPLYYLISASAYKMLDYFSISNINFHLQVLSLFIFSFFLIFSVKSLKLIIPDKKLLIIASSLVVFWPSGILNSIRIGNDVMFYALAAAAFFYFIKWWRFERRRYFLITMIISSLILLTKLNGAAILFVAMALVYKTFIKIRSGDKNLPFKNQPATLSQRGRLVFSKEWAMFLIISVVVSGAILYKPIFGFYKEGQIQNRKFFARVTKNDSLNGALSVDNKLENYLWFDAGLFNKETFTTSWEDKGGRQYFWNYLIKTSLFGEFYADHYKERGWVAANYLSWISMFMFFYLVASFLIFNYGNAGHFRKFLPAIFMSIISFMAMSVFYRVKAPFACNGDFRFAFPVVLPIAVFYTIVIDNYRTRNIKAMEYVGYFLAVSMTVVSILFFVLIS